MPRRQFALPAITMLAMMAAHAAAAAKPDPAQQTQALIAALKTFAVPPEGQAPSSVERETNRAAGLRLDSFFAYDRLIQAALGPQASRFNAAQRSRFDRDFRELVREVSFMRSAAFVKHAEVEVRPPETRGRQVLVAVHAAVPADDVETDLAFIYEDTGAAWQIVDVDFDGVSFAKDYQNQFAKLIKKDGVEGLLKKLAARLQREQGS